MTAITRVCAKVFATMLLLAVLLVAGPATTRRLISDDVGAGESEREQIARRALADARVKCLDHPIAAAMTPKLSLRRITIADDTGAAAVPAQARDVVEETPSDVRPDGGRPSLTPAQSSDIPPYEAEFRKYSWFAIPSGTIVITHDGSLASADCTASR